MQHYWNTLPGMSYAYAKVIIPSYSCTPSEELLSLNRKQIRVMTGLLTGHLNLKSHLHRIGRTNDDICRLCNEEEETAAHLLCNCMALESKIYLNFSMGKLDPSNFVEAL